MLDELIKKVDTKRAELDSLRPIKVEFMEKIKEKLSLDFNYYSNKIEGNTLTQGETNSLIRLGMNATIAKNQRDIQEMMGHIDAVTDLEFFKEKFYKFYHPAQISQLFIKNLHSKIFVKDLVKQSIQDGMVRTAVLKAGEYKQFENSVMQKDGTIFKYISAHETPSLMTDLVDWYNRNTDKLHPVILATLLHYKFIRIHPFGDGNGRMARLLMNYVLQSAGYSIVIITSDDRDNYISKLDLTNNNFTNDLEFINSELLTDFEPFLTYICNLELEYLDLMIRGAKGDSLLDMRDTIKLAQLKQEYQEINKDNKTKDKIFKIENQANEAIIQYNFLLKNIFKYCEAVKYDSCILSYIDNSKDDKKVTDFENINFENINTIQFLKKDDLSKKLTLNILENDFERNLSFNVGGIESKNFEFEYIDLRYEEKTDQLLKALDKLIF